MAAGALTESFGGTAKAVADGCGDCDGTSSWYDLRSSWRIGAGACIERNTMGAIKAITASQLALQSGTPDFATVSLDKVIKTMWDTALDMNSKYKETSNGGLATNIPLGLSEC